jgi:hypothetical protein
MSEMSSEHPLEQKPVKIDFGLEEFPAAKVCSTPPPHRFLMRTTGKASFICSQHGWLFGVARASSCNLPTSSLGGAHFFRDPPTESTAVFETVRPTDQRPTISPAAHPTPPVS